MKHVLCSQYCNHCNDWNSIPGNSLPMKNALFHQPGNRKKALSPVPGQKTIPTLLSISCPGFFFFPHFLPRVFPFFPRAKISQLRLSVRSLSTPGRDAGAAEAEAAEAGGAAGAGGRGPRISGRLGEGSPGGKQRPVEQKEASCPF